MPYIMSSENIILIWAPEIQAISALLFLLLYFASTESSLYQEYVYLIHKSLTKSVKTSLLSKKSNSIHSAVAGPKNNGSMYFTWCIVWCLIVSLTLFFKPINILYASGLFCCNNLICHLDLFLFLFAALCFIITKNWLTVASVNCVEYGIFGGIILLGQHFLLMSTDLMSFYICLELQSFSFVILCSLNKRSLYSIEAGMKYFLLSAFSSCFLLLGIAFIYQTTGITQCKNLESLYFQSSTLQNNNLFTIGIWLVSLTLLWKLAAAPNHLWAADVYTGAYAAVTLLISTLPKFTIFNFFILQWHGLWMLCFPNILAIFSALCLLLGALAAFGQIHIKRLLAYSSIAHIGFLCMPLVGYSFYDQNIFLPNSYALWTHLIIYFITSLIIWALLCRSFFRSTIRSTPQFIFDFSNLYKTQPMIAIALVIVMISLAGLPPSAGFLGKWTIFWGSVYANNYIILAIALISTCISSVYYLKLIRISFISKPTQWSYFGQCASSDAYIISICLFLLSVLLWASSPLILYTHYWSLLV
uniref:NADH dehydrogenase subunit 2 n=1 Tax=Jenufa minuta TaxID=993092 RepID=A0A6G7ITP2_JENMI|nr:NADH dehydrogenase subunit 2 [Jenufa minuta]QII41634.1 NADH dehydrogenase subunit 2 [Jenufa minuta]